MSAFHPTLQKLCDGFSKQIRNETGLSPTAVFRYLAHMSGQLDRLHPLCAFVECTISQAEGHADEISRRLETPCLALTTDDLASGGQVFPTSVHTLITTSFHVADVVPFHCPPKVNVLDVAVEMSNVMVNQMRGSKNILIICVGQENAEKVTADARERLGKDAGKLTAIGAETSRLLALLDKHLPRKSKSNDTCVVLSTSHWEAIPPDWIDHPNVVQLRYTICEVEWPRIAEAIGVPVFLPTAP